MTIVAAEVEGKANRIIVGYTNIIGYGFVSMNKRYLSLVFFIYIYKMKKIMKEKNQVVPDEVLSREFLSQFKTEVDVSKFLNSFMPKYWKKRSRVRWMSIWAMRRILWQETTP